MRQPLCHNAYSPKPFYPFGMVMFGRSYSTASSYRFGFEGKEDDNEVKGQGNSLDFGARMYDSRLGRWLSPDYYEYKYPSVSTYCFVGNMPLIAIDPDGRKIVIVYRDEKGHKQKYTYQPGVAYTGDNKFVAQTVASLDYVSGVTITLRNEHHNIVQEFVNIKRTIKIVEGKVGNTYYNSITRKIHYNNADGLLVVNNNGPTGERQTPALGLLHELSHAYDQFILTKDQKREISNEFKHETKGVQKDYQHKAEYFPIAYVERQAAIKLHPTEGDQYQIGNHEGTRNNHYGRTYRATSPTSLIGPKIQIK